MGSEAKFVNLLRSPGIDSQPDGPVQQSFLTYRPARLQRLAEGLLKCLQIRALEFWNKQKEYVQGLYDRNDKTG
jgi:hypothetical protein